MPVSDRPGRDGFSARWPVLAAALGLSLDALASTGEFDALAALSSA